jgi:imidazolonepropionase-like amidohydrolase
MVETGALLVPTRWIVEFLMAEGEKRGIPRYAKKKIEETAEYHADAIALAIESGVKIALGTDIWATGLWGRNAEELDLLVDCGMTPLQAIEAATANGPDTLGPQAPKAGQLVEGYDADVICVSGDPTADVTILADPTNITHVFKAGEQVKPRT